MGGARAGITDNPESNTNAGETILRINRAWVSAAIVVVDVVANVELVR